MNLGDEYCDQKLYVVISRSTKRGMVVIADNHAEAVDNVKELLGAGPYDIRESDVVSGVVAIGDNFKEA